MAEFPTIPYFTFVLEDAKGARARFKMNCERLDPSDFTAGATYESMGDNLMQDWFPLTTGLIVNATVTIPITIDTGVVDQSNRPLPDSDVEEGAYFGFRTESGHTTGFRIPTWNEDYFVQDTQIIDLSQSEVSDFVDTVINGPDAIAGVGEDRFNMTDNRGSDIVSLETGKDSFTKSRKNVVKKTRYTP